MSHRRTLGLALGTLLLAGGCALVPVDAPEPAPAPVAVARPPEPTEGRRWLDRGIAQFEQGKFVESLRILQESPEIDIDGPEVRAQALKYVAFNQCVTARRAACRRTFDALLTLDPGFALAPVEAGHPVWGPEFERARAAARAGAAKAASSSPASARR
ncbi:MAG: TssQ family T6SS-associated lipoprotein [Burkholderiaceae bacterium]